MEFRIGIIGAGTHGARYARHAVRDVPGMALAAVCRRQEEAGRALATELGCRYHREPGDLIADPDVDGVVVCTPPSTHFALSRDVLAAGKALLLEKPMTGTLAEAHELVELDARVGPAPLMVAQTLRWNPVIREVKELWPRLGRVKLVRMAQRLAPTTLGWQRDLAETVGGSVLLTGVHIFDLARWLTGAEFVEIDSRQENVMNPVVEDLFLARGVMSDDCWVSLEVSKYTQSRCCWLEAVGESGQLWADYLTGGIVLRSGAQEEQFAVDASTPTLPLVLKDWLASQKEEPVPVTVTDGLATLAVADACYRSAAMGKAVSV